MYRKLFCILLSMVLSSWLYGADIKVSPAASAPTLSQLTQKANYIFSGTVLSVELIPAKTQNAIATVRVTFRVDQAVRGVSARQILTIHEWAGLWDSGDRYRPGEQVLLFLYPPSKLGLTSPVNGNFGRFKMDSNGRILLNSARLAALHLNVVPPPPVSRGITSINRGVLIRGVRRAGDLK